MIVKQLRNNHKGFTLVELIIGVAILAIIATPLLSMFSSSARTSARSAQMGEATQVGENVAEQLEAMDLSAVLPTDSGEVPSISHTAEEGGGSSEATFYKLEVDGSYTALGEGAERMQSEHSYHAGFSGVQMQYGQYDVMVDFELGTPTDSVTGDVGSGYGNLNQASIPQYTPMDYVFNQNNSLEDPDESALQKFIQDHRLDTTLSMDSPGMTGERKITIEILEVDHQVQFFLEMNYSFSYNQEGAPTIEGEVTTDKSEITPQGGVEVAEGEEYPAFYVLFNPWYYGAGDEVEIINANNCPVTIVLAKQKTIQSSEEREMAYEAEVLLTQSRTEAIPPVIVAEEGAQILSNMGINLETGQPNNHATFRIQTGSIFVLTREFEEGNDLVVQEEGERIFQTTIKVFERIGDSPDYNQTPLYEFTTTNLQ